MAYSNAIPRSVVNPNGETVASQRTLAAVTGNNGAPAADYEGHMTGNRRNMHIMVQETGGGTCTLRIWCRNRFSCWGVLHTTNLAGAGAAVTIAVSALEQQWMPVLVQGVDAVYIEVYNAAGTLSLDVWVATSDGLL